VITGVGLQQARSRRWQRRRGLTLRQLPCLLPACSALLLLLGLLQQLRHRVLQLAPVATVTVLRLPRPHPGRHSSGPAATRRRLLLQLLWLLLLLFLPLLLHRCTSRRVDGCIRIDSDCRASAHRQCGGCSCCCASCRVLLLRLQRPLVLLPPPVGRGEGHQQAGRRGSEPRSAALSCLGDCGDSCSGCV